MRIKGDVQPMRVGGFLTPPPARSIGQSPFLDNKTDNGDKLFVSQLPTPEGCGLVPRGENI